LKGALERGQRVGGARYILKRVLGHGASGSVWLAWDVKLAQDLALKILPEAVIRNPNALERLKTETERKAGLVHPNIVRLHDFVHDQHLAAISMEYVEGWSLAALRVDKPQHRYRLQEITPWVRQLCAALTYAHTEAGLLHLDLKPANLLLNSREQLKVTDFGLARSLHGIVTSTELTAALSTLGFLSPQQVLGENPSVPDDVYGFGATLYDLLTGTPPFYKGQVLAQVCELTPPTLSARLRELGIDDGIPAVVEDTVAQCLEKNPAKRPQSIAAVLKLLERSEVPARRTKPLTGDSDPPPRTTARAEAPAPAAPPPIIPPSVQPPPIPVPAEPPPAAATAPVAAETAPPPPAPAPPPRSRRNFILLTAAVCGLAVLALGAVLWTARHSAHLFAKAGPPGTLDTAFRPATNADHEIRIVLEQPDRKIVIGGMFTQFGDAPHRGLARLLPDGRLDATYAATTGGEVFALALQPDGKLIIGGDFPAVNESPCRSVARLNPDGSLDEEFTAKAGVNRVVRAAVVQPDGKVLIAGGFTTVAGKRQNRIARFDADGARDTTFKPGAGAQAVIWSLALQADGKILAGGDFTSFSRKQCGRLARLNSDGSLDTEFDTSHGADASVFAVAVQRDGKVLIAGDFTHVNEVERSHIARLNADGTLDVTFDPGAGTDWGVRCLALQPDGKILIGGIFTTVQDQPRNRIARLSPDGSLDTEFDPGDGANEVVRWVAPQADGNVLVVGGFARFGTNECNRIVRLHGGSR
jgi:uncharacterized delta-60 repeat protein